MASHDQQRSSSAHRQQDLLKKKNKKNKDRVNEIRKKVTPRSISPETSSNWFQFCFFNQEKREEFTDQFHRFKSNKFFRIGYTQNSIEMHLFFAVIFFIFFFPRRAFETIANGRNAKRHLLNTEEEDAERNEKKFLFESTRANTNRN